MTPKQIEIGDKLLKILLDNEGSSDMDHFPVKLHKQGYQYPEMEKALDSLVSFNFVERNPKMFRIQLTPEGYQAAKIGIEAYDQQKANAANLDIRSKRTGIRSSNWTLIISGAAFLVSVASFFKDSLIQPAVLSEKTADRENDGSGSDNDIKHSESKVLVSELIPEIANSLKHDSIFVKELAEELEKQM